MSISTQPFDKDGVSYHQTVQGARWWVDFFKAQGFTNHLELVEFFGNDWVRGPMQNTQGTFHLVLMRSADTPPEVPTSASYSLQDGLAVAQEFLDQGNVLYPLSLMEAAAEVFPANIAVVSSLALLRLCAAQLEVAQACAVARHTLTLDPQHVLSLKILAEGQPIGNLLRNATGLNL